MEITEEIIKKNAHISNSEIQQDIIDTQREIDQYAAELEILRKDMQGNRVSIYMNEGHISMRKAFIVKLENLLEKRKGM